MTGFQSLLNRGAAMVEQADPETVAIEGFPPLSANVGSIYRRRVMTDTSWRTQVRGTLEIRRSVLAEKAPGVPDPESGMPIEVRGVGYRVDFTTGDTITLRIEFASFI